ncbi:MAG: tetratricopeptide repeat protein [Caldimonas sp.]
MLDCRGNPVSTTSRTALDATEQALWRAMSFYGTPLDDLDSATSADPAWVLPELMRAAFLLSMTEPALAAQAGTVLDHVRPLLAHANQRERAHHHALVLLQTGDWTGACAAWEALLLDQPRDALALQSAHLYDFYRGDAANLRQRVARVLPEWDESDPLFPYVLGLYAFGLEESNLHDAAEEVGRRALSGAAKVPWAIHAVAHVMEMQGRHADGSSWMQRWRPDWSDGNGFAVHLGWHQALFALESLDHATALALFDAHMPAAKTQVTLERLDAASLLWRLHLLGVDAGPRWHELVSGWDWSEGSAGFYAFNDLHALFALLGSGDLARADAWVRQASARAEAGRGANREMARAVGAPLMHGMLAFARGRYQEAIERLLPIRSTAHRFGGSHAQRDVIDQTLLAAAALGGATNIGRALLNERMLAKPRTPLTAHWASRLGAAAGPAH